MKRIKKYAALLLAVIIAFASLTGCSGSGATITTKMKVNKDFAGKRVIEVFIPKSSLDEYVDGGLKALKSTATKKLPKQMTLASKSKDDGATLTFTVAFTSLDDYNAKVKKIIGAGSNEKLVPEISYENLNTYFKKGVYFKENFTSADLLQWYFDAIEKAKIISQSQSNWYTMGETALSIGGTKYDTGSTMSVDKRELCCLDRIDVETFVNYDGSYKRVIVFDTNESTVKTLADKGCVLKDYLSALVAKGDKFEDTSPEGDYTYTITLNAKNAEELIKKTDAVLQTKNSFAIATEIDKERLGMAKVTLSEKLDGSYYLNYGYGRPLHSKINMYDNVKLVKDESGASANLSDDVLTYSPFAANENKFELDWKISFETVEIVTEIKNEKNITVDFIFTAAEALADDLKNAAIDALKQSCGKAGEFSKDKNSCTISFNGSIEEVTKKINGFIGFNDTEKSEDKSYFNISFTEAVTASKLTNSYHGDISYDLSPVIGNTRVLFNDNEGLFNDYYYQGSFEVNEDGNKTAASSGSVEFTLVKTSVVVLILLAVFILFFIAGVVIIVLNLKKIIALFKELTEKKKAAKEAKQTAADEAAPENDEPQVEFEEQGEEETDEEPAVEAPVKEEEEQPVEVEAEAIAQPEAELVPTAEQTEDETEETEDFI